MIETAGNVLKVVAECLFDVLADVFRRQACFEGLVDRSGNVVPKRLPLCVTNDDPNGNLLEAGEERERESMTAIFAKQRSVSTDIDGDFVPE
ncbi:hypothetical protein [Natronorubrum thiooxidans]|uniref:Uncharacterized protein n=1 Tax=Natronorubrum thiooxidans TaxID=308853 RepID=A0A1N7CK08_9EURY|nr:hypothetical protein [Natronorubrum thiooxidans]SIR63919.1 hypothetical protein SAMN05421752_101411 [Natronorubrum thiooxidans]